MTQNPQIGRNFYAHPINSIGAFWEDNVKPWDGMSALTPLGALSILF